MGLASFLIVLRMCVQSHDMEHLPHTHLMRQRRNLGETGHHHGDLLHGVACQCGIEHTRYGPIHCDCILTTDLL